MQVRVLLGVLVASVAEMVNASCRARITCPSTILCARAEIGSQPALRMQWLKDRGSSSLSGRTNFRSPLVVSVLSSVEVTKGLRKLGLEGPNEARYRGTRALTRNVAPLRTCPSNFYALVP